MSAATFRKYETVVVTRHDAGHEAQRKLHQRITELMEKEGARPVRFEFWGKRRLAYPIAKATKGIYMYHVYLADGDFVKKLTRTLQLSQIVLRYLTVRLSDGVDPSTYDFEKEQHFDTLPTEADEGRDHGPTTGWNAEVAGEGAAFGDEEADEDEESDEDSDEDEE